MKLFLCLFTACLLEATSLPQFDHIVVVIEENHSFKDVVGVSAAPYINQLIKKSALFSQSFGVIVGSQPNYLALFSGSTQHVGNEYHPKFNAQCLGSLLISHGKTFVCYSDGLPYAGFNGISSGAYVRRHNPSTQFTTLSDAANQPFSAFPKNFNDLPTVAFVVPSLAHDAHDGSLAQADGWLKKNLGAYIEWAKSHNSLLILTFDEETHRSRVKNIPTFFYGAHVKPGVYTTKINHYNILRTLEDLFHLPYLGASATATPITNIWVYDN